ncbi:hypothetical protein [Streptomyces sp. NPDC051211]
MPRGSWPWRRIGRSTSAASSAGIVVSGCAPALDRLAAYFGRTV